MPGMNTGLEGIRRRFDTSTFDQHFLSNGVSVWMQDKQAIKIHDMGIVVACFPRVGSIQDPKGQEGVAHIREHISFRGTTHMPDTDSILNPLEEEVALWNGGTGPYFTQYYVILPRDQMEMATETTFEFVACPLIREKDVILERGLIANEYKNNVEGIGKKWSDLHCRQAVFGQHPYVHNPMGYPESIEKMTAEMLRNFQEAHYHVNNLQIICGGAFSERADALHTLDKKFGSLPRSNQVVATIPSIPIPQKQVIELSNPSYGTDRIVFTWRMERPPDDRGKNAFKLLADVLSGRLNSPLIANLRLKLGILYRSGLSSFTQEPNAWIFEVNIPVESKHFATAEEALFECLVELKEAEILKGQRICQKQRLSALGFLDAITVCAMYTTNELICHGRPVGYHETESDQDDVELGEVFDCRDFLLSADRVIGKIRVK